MFFAVIIGIFSLGQAVPHFEKFVSAAGASIAVYDIIDQVRGAAYNGREPERVGLWEELVLSPSMTHPQITHMVKSSFRSHLLQVYFVLLFRTH